MGLAGNRSYSSAGFTSVRTNDFNHSILIGLRYQFGAAPAPVEATPMPVAEIGAKTFMVFFDWDKADLTARSAGFVRDAAGYSTSAKYTRIDVAGNTDTSGAPAHNQRLSERRARVVAAELVRDGVPQTVIDMHAYGDTHLLVPTGPGVREPQNRRVEIVYHQAALICPGDHRLAIQLFVWAITCCITGHDRRLPHPGGRGRRPPA